MAISRANMMKELIPGLNALFGLEYERYENQHEAIYVTETSDRSFEEEVKLSGFGAAPVKSEGDAIQYDSAQESYTARYTHETVALGFSITQEAVEDNLYEQQAGRYTKALARAMAHTKQVKAVVPLNFAYNSAMFSIGDGGALCQSRTTTGGFTNANLLSTPADLSEASLEAATIAIADFVDERGLMIAARPVKLIIPSELQFTATRILESNQRVETADNDINALRNNGVISAGYSINNFLVDGNNWFLTTDIPNGLKHFVRAPITNDMDGDFDTGNVRYKARERYSFGCSDYMAIFGSGAVA